MYLNFYRCAQCSCLSIRISKDALYKIALSTFCATCDGESNVNFVQQLICTDKQGKALLKYYENNNIPIF